MGVRIGPVGTRQQRWSIRLHGYDYGQAGAYFVTIGTKDRACFFGEIEHDVMVPSAAGNLVASCWEAIPDHFPDVELDAYVIMPNHLHGIVVLGTEPERGTDGDMAGDPGKGAAGRSGTTGTACRAPTGAPSPPDGQRIDHERFGRPAAGSLPTIIRSFKGAVTKRFGEMTGRSGRVLWQRNYYEHIIRDDRALDRIRTYIADNPSRWAEDDENPTRPIRARHALPIGPNRPAEPPPAVGARHAVPVAPNRPAGPRAPNHAALPLAPYHPAGPVAVPVASAVSATPALETVGSSGNDEQGDVLAARARHAVPLPGAGRRHIPPGTAHIGNLAILDNHPLVALFCSVRCPGRLILRTYDLACELRDAGMTVIGGFHTPMERECLTFLLKGSQPVVICPARGVERMRVPADWKAPMADGRLLVLSPIPVRQRRVTAVLAEQRNAFVASLADQVFVAHAAPGGKTEALCRGLLASGKPVLTFDDPDNANLLAHGARPLTAQGWI